MFFVHYFMITRCEMKTRENFLVDNERIVLKTYHSLVEPQKRALREHHHTECELSLFIKGQGTYNVCGREYHFSDGDMFLFAGNEAHCITEINEPLDLLNIQFEPRILWESADSAELLNIFNMRNEKFQNMFSKSDASLRCFILDIENEVGRKNTSYKIKTKYLLFSAIIHILRSYDYVKNNVAFSHRDMAFQRLNDAMSYIDNNLENKLTLKNISSVACMSQTYFSAIFKKYNGIPPWEYITIKRVEKAIKLLRTTDMTKLEIAEKCGFSSSSNFYKAFFNVTGKTPTELE